MLTSFASVLVVAGDSLLRIIPVSLGLAVTFGFISGSSACNLPARPWWRKRQIITDMCYWFITPVAARFARIGFLIVAAAVFFNIHGAKELIRFYQNGHGPLSHLPLSLQVVAFILASDFLCYWIHRALHSPRLWKYHAIHHSSDELDWISAERFHPVNLLLGSVAVDVGLLVAGFSPNVMIFIIPFTVAYSGFVHANLDWTLGPLRYVVASPVFHRWHHAARYHGSDTNFAALLPIWDLLFATFSMPIDRRPDAYGISEGEVPENFGKQMLYPFVA
jgi:sterol desaturase/sphingolipid hydroxylase (fatty acid hydroxylase superfamily)